MNSEKEDNEKQEKKQYIKENHAYVSGPCSKTNHIQIIKDCAIFNILK